MENQKNNKGIIAILIVIIVILSGLCVLFATGTISLKSNEVTNDETNEIVNITKEEANDVVNKIMDKFYVEIFYGHKNTYCGEYDYNDIIVGERATQYHKSNAYNNLSDLKQHLNTYMTPELVNKLLDNAEIPNYQEKDGKLYCLVHGRGSLSYDKNNTSYSIKSFTDNVILAKANVSALSEGNNVNSINADLVFKKINNVWLLSSYDEKID